MGVYIAGRKCPRLAAECIASLRAQTFGDWLACVTIDGTDDKQTFDACADAARGDRRVVINWMSRVHSCQAKLAAIAALVHGFGQLADDDTLVGLDLDDRFLPGALQKIHDVHKAGAWITYGNWVDQHSERGTEFRFMTPILFEHIREVSWFMTAPNSFRVSIFRAIPEEYFRWNDGHGYYETGFDGSLMFAAADLADVDRIMGIRDPIYVYNRERPENVLQTWPKDHRVRLFDEQRGKPRLDRLDPERRGELLPASREYTERSRA